MAVSRSSPGPQARPMPLWPHPEAELEITMQLPASSRRAEPAKTKGPGHSPFKPDLPGVCLTDRRSKDHYQGAWPLASQVSTPPTELLEGSTSRATETSAVFETTCLGAQELSTLSTLSRRERLATAPPATSACSARAPHASLEPLLPSAPEAHIA